ncbi:MAG: VWA domain-containing protein [Saprospiraceae bacterium]
MMQKTFLLSLLSLLFLTFGCKDDDLPFNDCFQKPKGNANLNITLLDSVMVTLPSKVSVFFKLTDENGNPVGFLEPDNFEIYEKGLNDQCPRVISESEAARKISGKEQIFNHTTMLVLDLSGSVLQQTLEPLKNAATDFIDAIMPDTTDNSTQMGIWWFDGEDLLHTLVPVTSSKSTLKLGILAIDPNISSDASTDLYGAVIKSAAKATDILDVNQAGDMIAAASVVIFTDGRDRANRYTRNEAVTAVANTSQDISFFTIGVGSETEAADLVAFGRNGYVPAANAGQLASVFENVASLVSNEANSYYLFEYCSPIRSGTSNGLIIEASFRKSNETLFGYFETTFDATGFGGGCQL